MKIKHISRRVCSLILSASLASSMFIIGNTANAVEVTSTGLAVDAVGDEKDFETHWSDSYESYSNIPNNGLVINLNGGNIENRYVNVTIDYESVPYNDDLRKPYAPVKLGSIVGKWQNTDSGRNFYNANGSMGLQFSNSSVDHSGSITFSIGADTATAIIPIFRNTIDDYTIWESYGSVINTANLNEYLCGKYKIEYTLTLSDEAGRTINTYTSNSSDEIAVGDNSFSGILDSSTEERFQFLNINLNEPTMQEPVYADSKSNLPNYGIIVDMSDVDFSTYPDTNLVIKFNPNGDKNLNSQPDNYNDSAVKLQASTGVWHTEYYREGSSEYRNSYQEKTTYEAIEAYPDSNSYQCSYIVPVDSNHSMIVFRVFPGASRTNFEQYLSRKFNFSYEISLEDKYGRTIKSYSKEDGNTISVSNNYIAGGILSDISNPLDKWKINLNNGVGNPPSKTNIDGGLQFEFAELPTDFSYSQLSIKLQLTEKGNSGYSAFGYSQTKYDNDFGGNSYTGYSNYNGGAVLDYVLKYGSNGFADHQSRIGYGSDRVSEIQFSTYYKGSSSYVSRYEIYPTQAKSFAVIPESTEYSFNYSFESLNSKYKIEVVNSNVEYTTENGIITSNKSVSSTETALHKYTLKVVDNDILSISDLTTTACTEKSGLPNWGILYDYENFVITSQISVPTSINIKSDDYITFVMDEYFPTSPEMKYFIWSQGGTAAGDTPYNLSDGSVTDGNDYYNENNKYFLAERVGIYTAASDKTLIIDNSGYTCKVYPMISEITIEEYDDNTLDFELNGKYYHPEVTEISRNKYNSQNYKGYAFEMNNRYWLINNEKEVFPIISIRPVTTKYAPLKYSYDYFVSYSDYSYTYELSKLEEWKYSSFEAENFTIYPSSSNKSYKSYNGYGSDSITLTNENGFSLIRISTRSYINNGTNLDTLLDLYSGTSGTAWIDKDTGEYIGKFNIADVSNGLLVTADKIINKAYELPYVNIDLKLKENAYSNNNAGFTSIFGEIKDGIFYIKESHTGDWSTNVKQSYSSGYNHTEGGGSLSSEYTYTIHAHLDENEAVFIFPNDYSNGMGFDYEISTRNIARYNIDGMIDEPTGNIERSVGNNIIYKGSTETTRLQNTIQKVTLSFKGYHEVNTTASTYQQDDVKYIPVRLFDYNFINEQTAELQFLYNTQSTSNAPQNTWHDGVYSNIIENEIDYLTDSFGLPKFKFSTPFNNLFSIENETDENGNTKTTYDTVLEFSYDSENSMYYYNSLLHAATYDSERNAILTYQSALGIDNWGMQGAGFFPFNSFSDKGKWGSASKYNANTWLVSEDDINYHFGMGMNLDFEMPEKSQSDIIYKFTGDDDIWVFVDDKLVLDLGGIHEAMTGTINLTQGTYTVDSSVYKLSSVLQNADFSAKTKHNIKMFYLERGGTLSNCSIQFNIPIENDVPTYKLSYDSNGATSGEAPIDETPYFENEIANIINDSGTAEKNGYRFMGWTIKSDSTDTISTIKMESDKTVYAVWQELEHLELPVTGSNSELMLIVVGILLTGTGTILLIRKKKKK